MAILRTKEGSSAHGTKSKNGRCDQWVLAFVLGFLLAMFLCSTVIVAAVIITCSEINFSIEQACPLLIRNPTENYNWRARFLREQPIDEFLVVRPDPLEATCHWVANAFSWAAQKQSSSQSMTCTPVVTDNQVGDSNGKGTTTRQFKNAYSIENLHVTEEQKQLVVSLGKRVEENVANWTTRASKVPWGGYMGAAWFDERKNQGTDLEGIKGGFLFYSYLRIMQWPKRLRSNIPSKLCAKECNSEVALLHTLEFREKFKPWLVSASTIKENENGCVFHRGFSPSLDNESIGHALVWVRPGKRAGVDDIFLTRAYVNTLERAVASSLVQSKGRVGKFNVVVDGDSVSWSLMPTTHQLKVFVGILQDHFPSRLGTVLLVNLGSIGELVVRLVRPLISEEVRHKLVVLPKDATKREAILEAVIGVDNIPTWLGGSDHYSFHVDTYYSEDLVISDEDSLQYLSTMPYHA